MITYTNYITTDLKGNIKKVLTAPCFRDFYNCAKLFPKIEVFYTHKEIEQARQKETTSFYKPVAQEEISRYLDLLQKIGFNFEYSNNTTIDDEPCNSIIIDTTKNSIVVIKILLNAYRYCYENNYTDIVRKFLEIAKDNNRSRTLFSKLIIAHYLTPNYWSYGHAFLYPKDYYTLLNKEELKKNVFENDDNGYCYLALPRTTKPNQEGDMYGRNVGEEAIKNFYKKEKDITKIIKHYKKLCEKYS